MIFFADTFIPPEIIPDHVLVEVMIITDDQSESYCKTLSPHLQQVTLICSVLSLNTSQRTYQSLSWWMCSVDIMDRVDISRDAPGGCVAVVAVAQVPLADGVGHVAARLEVLGQQLVLRAQACTQKYLRTIKKYLPLTGWLVSADVAALEAEAPGVLAGEERGPAGGAGGVGVVPAQDNPGPGHSVMVS